MAFQFDFLSPTDKPALVATNNLEWLGVVQTVLAELGYKVHVVETHKEFSVRFAEVPYQVVVLDQNFDGDAENNVTLRRLQQMPMSQRRHAVIILIGPELETLNALHAFQQSVHALVNYSELALLDQLIQKVVNDNALLLHTFRETQDRVARSRA